MARRIIMWSAAPLYRPVSASPAKANPSMKYENNVKNCISSALTASMRSPCIAPMRVNHIVTDTRHTVRRNMSVLTRKKRFRRGISKISRKGARASEQRRRARSSRTENSVHWAISVPVAIPAIPRWNMYTSERLATILVTLINMDVHIVTFEFCMPRNHPESAKVAR